MEDLSFTTQTSFLHHGIEGQKWGVQNGPPYPLNRATKKALKRQIKERQKEYEMEMLYKASIGEIPYSQVERYMKSSAASEDFKKAARKTLVGLAVLPIAYIGKREIQRFIDVQYAKRDHRVSIDDIRKAYAPRTDDDY